MLGKSHRPEIARANARANMTKVANAKAGVKAKRIADKMDVQDVTNAVLRDARIEYLSTLPKRGHAKKAPGRGSTLA